MRDVFARTQFSRRRVLISMIGSAPFAATWRLYRRAVEREARVEGGTAHDILRSMASDFTALKAAGAVV